MGNQNHKSGGMVVVFEQPYYFPGQLVKGSIYMQMNEAYQTKGLEITVKTKELVIYHEYEMKQVTKKHLLPTSTTEYYDVTTTENVKVERKEKRTLFKQKILMATMMNDILGMGQYCYPFSFILPSGLPGSFEYYDDDISACIKYSVKARAQSWVDKQHDLKYSNILIVRQPFAIGQDNSLYRKMASHEANITTWCCFSKGRSEIKVEYDKNEFFLNEVVNTVCTLDNQRCTLPATSINLQLFQQLSLTVKGYPTKRFDRKIAESAFTGNYLPGQINTRPLALEITDRDNPTLRHLSKCDHIHLFRDSGVVSQLQATVMGMNIQCKYYLRATAYFDGCLCCSDSPTVDIPVIIYIPNNIYFDFEKNFKPNNWNPVVMPEYQLNLPSIGPQGQGNMNMNVNSNQQVGMVNMGYQNPGMTSNNQFNSGGFQSDPNMGYQNPGMTSNNQFNSGGFQSNPNQGMFQSQ